jgi:HSP20 family protein
MTAKKKRDGRGRRGPDDDEPEDDFYDEDGPTSGPEDDPFGLGDDFFRMLADQMKAMFQNFPGVAPPNLDPKMIRSIFNNIMRSMNLDPNQMRNMSPEDLQRFVAKNKMGFQPFVFGMNFGFGPDGKPNVSHFGNVKTKPEGDAEIKVDRDPLIDIYEEGEDLVIVAEVPGVKKNDIELKASPLELEIMAGTGEHDKVSRNYRKVIPLPIEINPDVAKARYTNGILEVRLKITGKKQSRRKIEID